VFTFEATTGWGNTKELIWQYCAGKLKFVVNHFVIYLMMTCMKKHVFVNKIYIQYCDIFALCMASPPLPAVM
jgi:hypothetical protein